MWASGRDLAAVLMPAVSWVKFCFDLSVTGQSEDGADQDSPEEGTPASPRNKRRVGRPGRKRKQLLPVSTAITGWRQPFKGSSGKKPWMCVFTSDCSRWTKHTSHAAFSKPISHLFSQTQR